MRFQKGDVPGSVVKASGGAWSNSLKRRILKKGDSLGNNLKGARVKDDRSKARARTLMSVLEEAHHDSIPSTIRGPKAQSSQIRRASVTFSKGGGGERKRTASPG